jgi:ribosomal-protein-alanine N-acetyltransferase
METENLYLRRFTLDDAEAYWPLVSMPEIIRYTGDQAQASIDDARRILGSHPLRDYATHGFGRMACIEISSGRLVGFSGLKFVAELNEVDIGYRFLPDCWGKGYATESARVLMQQGANEHGVERIVGVVQPENVASARVLKKLGLDFERELTLHGDTDPVHLYATRMVR